MRYIDFGKIDITSNEMRNWLAEAARKKIDVNMLNTHDERKEYFKNNNIWTDLKPYFKEVYGKVCWYSETDLSGEYGDIDHFRPKSVSMDSQKKIILPDGYWWLAYDYKNYRLSCTVSNRPSGDDVGKRNYFPLKDSRTALHPGDDITNEEPVLLDPCCLYDTTLMGYSADGKPIPLTNDLWEIERVNFSIRAYNLKEFDTARKRIHWDCHLVFRLLDKVFPHINDVENNPDIGECISTCISRMEEYVSLGTPYSSVAYFYLREEIIGKPYENEIKNLLDKFYTGE